MSDRFGFRRVGTTGHDILFNGTVVAWTVNEAWAALIVAKLNKAPCVPAVGAGVGIPEAACCRREPYDRNEPICK